MTKSYFLCCLFAVMTLAMPGALAAQECLITYDEFEENVPHLDLEECPAGEVLEDEGFCRLGIERGLAILYVFRFEGREACLDEVDIEPLPDFVKKYGYR